MTFKEKLAHDHPEKSKLDLPSLVVGCPHEYGYENVQDSIDNCIVNGGKGCRHCWNREMPEERKESMENLKEKMDITTFVLLRDGKIGLVFMNPNSEDGKAIYNPLHIGCITYLSDYNDDLTYKWDSLSDIMKMRFPSKEENYRFVKKFFESDGQLKIDSYFKWDWEREEEPVTKDVSLEELNAILKEKFPDIDKFNLPIKE